MGSSHTKKFFLTFYRQKTGAKVRRQQKQRNRREEFIKRRETIRQQVWEMTSVQWFMALLVGIIGFAAGAIMMFYRVRG